MGIGLEIFLVLKNLFIYTNVQKRKVYYSSRSNGNTSFQVSCTFRLISGLFFGVPIDTVLQLKHIGSGLQMVRATLALQAEQVAVTQLRETHILIKLTHYIYPWGLRLTKQTLPFNRRQDHIKQTWSSSYNIFKIKYNQYIYIK